jgi:hypothetical protein
MVRLCTQTVWACQLDLVWHTVVLAWISTVRHGKRSQPLLGRTVRPCTGFFVYPRLVGDFFGIGVHRHTIKSLGLWTPICSRWIVCTIPSINVTWWEIRNDRFFKCTRKSPIILLHTPQYLLHLLSLFIYVRSKRLDFLCYTYVGAVAVGWSNARSVSHCRTTFWCLSTEKLARYFATVSLISCFMYSSNPCWSLAYTVSIVGSMMLLGEI